MYSALVGLLFLLSIGIMMAHAMEGLWLVGPRAKVAKIPRPLMRTSLGRDRWRDVAIWRLFDPDRNAIRHGAGDPSRSSKSNIC
jgi:hypothetical protein